jgi:hypothetical protein
MKLVMNPAHLHAEHERAHCEMAAPGTEEMIDWMWQVVGLLGQG